MAVSFAAPTADAEADAHLIAAVAPIAPVAVPAPVVVPAPVALPAPVAVAPVVPSNCAIEYEEIVSQVCTPRAETVCETKDVVAQSVEYKKLCKEVTSKHCAGGVPFGHVVAKREADADADAWYGYGGYGHAVHAPVAYHHEETVTSPCHEVVAEHCLNNPEIVETTVPVEQCHVVTKVDCVDKVDQIPKTVCEEVVTKVVRALPHPFGYAYGK